MNGLRLRFFSRRVFGAWVDAVVVAVGPRRVKLKARFGRAEWVEFRPVGEEFYYPAGHERAGEAFRLGGE